MGWTRQDTCLAHATDHVVTDWAKDLLGDLKASPAPGFLDFTGEQNYMKKDREDEKEKGRSVWQIA